MALKALKGSDEARLALEEKVAANCGPPKDSDAEIWRYQGGIPPFGLAERPLLSVEESVFAWAWHILTLSTLGCGTPFDLADFADDAVCHGASSRLMRHRQYERH
jgi:hypothetical protein